MSGSFLTGPPREAGEGGKWGIVLRHPSMNSGQALRMTDEGRHYCKGTPMMFGPRLAIADELVDGQFDVVRYLSKQNGGNVSVGMEGYCCGTPVGMAKQLVGSSLPNFFEAKLGQYRNHFFRLENRNTSHS
jgi:hypothetical protein